MIHVYYSIITIVIIVVITVITVITLKRDSSMLIHLRATLIIIDHSRISD